jgi:sugar transferase (PEP-CTERM/EpsH1 system associated)
MAAHHEVDLFTLADEEIDPGHTQALREYCRRVTVVRINTRLARLRSLPYLFTRAPLTLPYFHSRELHREMSEAFRVRSYERVFVYCSAMAQYVDGFQQVPILTDLVDVDSNKWTQYTAFTKFPFSAVYRREADRLREYERQICEKSSCVIVTTEREAQLVREITNAAPVYVISNGVDANYFSPTQVQPDLDQPTVVFTGDMSYFPNEEAVRYFAGSVLPMIQRSVPGARFLIVGRNPSRKVLALQKMDGVEVTGFVPDVRMYLAKAQVSVAPFSIAAGIQNKILEAMAYGLPVVATRRAIQGLRANVAELVETGDSTEELGGKVVRLLQDPGSARSIGIEGRRRVTAEYQWNRSMDELLQLLENPGNTNQLRSEAQSPCSSHAL